jgi:hypothetical protein
MMLAHPVDEYTVTPDAENMLSMGWNGTLKTTRQTMSVAAYRM